MRLVRLLTVKKKKKFSWFILKSRVHNLLQGHHGQREKFPEMGEKRGETGICPNLSEFAALFL